MFPFQDGKAHPSRLLELRALLFHINGLPFAMLTSIDGGALPYHMHHQWM